MFKRFVKVGTARLPSSPPVVCQYGNGVTWWLHLYQCREGRRRSLALALPIAELLGSSGSLGRPPRLASAPFPLLQWQSTQDLPIRLPTMTLQPSVPLLAQTLVLWQAPLWAAQSSGGRSGCSLRTSLVLTACCLRLCVLSRSMRVSRRLVPGGCWRRMTTLLWGCWGG